MSDQAPDIQPPEEPAAVRRAAPDDPTVQVRVDRTGASHGLGERPGDVIGHYKLLERIGEGGFGEVFLAEQSEPVRRRVALKIIKPGMDSREVIARFEAERQALALMDHPGIAKVFDAGATLQGRPFVVMEYIAGVPLTQHCDTHRLNIRQRLELFAEVCDAVAHAHTKGVIHRDLKPSNILVSVRDSGVPQCKIIDFGVAKAIQQRLTEQTLFTERGVFIGTPEYMSPEQAEMSQQDIDTRTDVYALGVVLYELLTGAVPFDPQALRKRGLDEIRRIIREEDPPRPSTRLSTQGAQGRKTAEDRHTRLEDLARTLRSELEWIPLKAMRKDRTERYRSANELADDVRNYLQQRPLIAGPESAAYRVRKYLRRNRASTAAAAMIAFALLLGLAGTLWQAREAGIERDAAKAAGEKQRQLAISEAAARKDADEKRLLAEQQTAEARWQAYVANMYAAQGAFGRGELRAVHQRLELCPAELRGWEWGWLNGASDGALQVFRSHASSLQSIAFDPTGTRVATASDDRTVRVWEALTGRELVVLRGHTRFIYSLAFSRDGRRILTAGDHTARIWDAADGRELARFEHEEEVFCASFDPAETRVVTASQTSAFVWDVTTAQRSLTLSGHAGNVSGAWFDPSGTRIVTVAWDGTARLWDADAGTSLFVLTGHGTRVSFARFSPDGQLLVTAGSDVAARLWNVASGERVAVLSGHINSVSHAAFSPDGGLLATTSSDGTARIWDGHTGAARAVCKGHTGPVQEVVFSHEGDRIATAADDNTARLWDASTGDCQMTLVGHESAVSGVAFNADDSLLATSSFDRTARIWDTTSPVERFMLLAESDGAPPDSPRTYAISNDRQRMAAVDEKVVRIFNWFPGQQVSMLKGHQQPVTSVAFSWDGARAITASADKTARTWEVETGKPLMTFSGHAAGINAAAFSRDGARVITAGEDNTTRIWDASTGQELLRVEGCECRVSAAVFSPDGTLAITAQFDYRVRVADAATGRNLHTLEGHRSRIADIQFSADGRRMYTASMDGTVRAWDTATWQAAEVLRGHDGGVYGLSLSPDASRIVTAGTDGTARIWDARSGDELAMLRVGRVCGAAAFSPDGTRVITLTEYQVQWWDGRSRRERYLQSHPMPPADTQPASRTANG